MGNGEFDFNFDDFFFLLLLLFSTELAASIPRTEIVGKCDFFRFGMRDSLAIEASFLQVLFWNSYLCCMTKLLFHIDLGS